MDLKILTCAQAQGDYIFIVYYFSIQYFALDYKHIFVFFSFILSKTQRLRYIGTFVDMTIHPDVR